MKVARCDRNEHISESCIKDIAKSPQKVPIDKFKIKTNQTKLWEISTQLTSSNVYAQHTKYGYKIKDGLYIEKHMEGDNRTSLVEKYKNHRTALIMIAGYKDSLPDDYKKTLKATVKQFNSFWEKQTKSEEDLESSSLDNKILTGLKHIMPGIYKDLKDQIPEMISDQISKAKSDSSYSRGLNYYLKQAKSKTSHSMGLEHYLKEAKSKSSYSKGLEYYLKEAKSKSSHSKGSKYYLEQAKSDSSYSMGKDYYLDIAKSSSSYTKGLEYFKQYADKAGNSWGKLQDAHKKYEKRIKTSHAKFELTIELINKGFNSKATKFHSEFVESIKAEHSKFLSKATKLFNTYKKQAQGLEDIATKGLDQIWDKDPSNNEGYKGLQSHLKKIKILNLVISSVNNKLSNKREFMSSAFGKAHSTLSKEYAALHSQFSTQINSEYQNYTTKLEAAYDAITTIFKVEYLKLSEKFESFESTYN